MSFWTSAGNWLANLFPGNDGPDQVSPATLTYPSQTGLPVTSETASNTAAVMACIRLLAETVSTLPLRVYDIDQEGTRMLAVDDPLFDLIVHEPSDLYSTGIWARTLIWHLQLGGNAFALILRDERGQISELQIQDPTRIRTHMDREFSVYYRHDSDGWTVPARDMLHFHILSEDGITGNSPISRARNAIGLMLAEERFGSDLFANGANQSGIITTDAVLNKEQRQQIRDGVAETYGGIAHQQKTMVLGGGAKYTRMSLSPDDSQFIESRKFQLQEIARIFRVPPAMIASSEGVTYGSYEMQFAEFLQNSIRPLAVVIEDEMNRKLYPQDWTKHIAFDLDARLRADTKTRSDYYTAMRSSQIMTRDEVRKKEGLPPLTDEQKAELDKEAQNVLTYQPSGGQSEPTE